MNGFIIQTKQEPSPVKKTVPAKMTVMLYGIHSYSGIALAPRALKEYIKQHRQGERSRIWTNRIKITLYLFLTQQLRKQ